MSLSGDDKHQHKLAILQPPFKESYYFVQSQAAAIKHETNMLTTNLYSCTL